MSAPDFDTWAAQARAEGFDEVIVREWQPGLVLEEHRHPFALKALVVRGEMWLTCDGATQTLGPGGRFALARDVPHAERYGDAGATVWVARRHA